MDEGNLIKMELLPLLKEVDKNVCVFTPDTNLAKYLSKFINMGQTSVINNKTLEMDLKLLYFFIYSILTALVKRISATNF